MNSPGSGHGREGSGRPGGPGEASSALEGVRARAIVTGIVQGVSFRWWTRREAETIGVTGWVRNLDDGSVEVVAEGPRPLVEKLISACRRGPYGARVEDVEVSWHPFTGEYAGFAIAH